MSCHYRKRHGKKLKCLWLSEKRQSEKTTYYMFSTIWHSGEKKTMETVKKELVIASGWGMRGMNSRVQRILGHWKYSV